MPPPAILRQINKNWKICKENIQVCKSKYVNVKENLQVPPDIFSPQELRANFDAFLWYFIPL